jgi:SAM-dependent methyltransferase
MDSKDFSAYLERYTRGEWRAPIFRDIILNDAVPFGPECVIADIGCGSGFDGDRRLQTSIAAVARQYIGIEPNTEIALGSEFTKVYRCPLEVAPISDATVDLAFAVMVLEHLQSPQAFWDKAQAILRPGGIFWGFTMDSRHWFSTVSRLAEFVRFKDPYLRLLHGKRGVDRYDNYPVFYRSNSPEQLERLTSAFRSRVFLNFRRTGQLDYYFPRGLRWLGRGLERIAPGREGSGTILAVRVAR